MPRGDRPDTTPLRQHPPVSAPVMTQLCVYWLTYVDNAVTGRVDDVQGAGIGVVTGRAERHVLRVWRWQQLRHVTPPTIPHQRTWRRLIKPLPIVCLHFKHRRWNVHDRISLPRGFHVPAPCTRSRVV